ncbi:MAG: caspase family protein [Lewinellaceae bacterium]|nr:caspase family protein [Lewinellaceae bacterium]
MVELLTERYRFEPQNVTVLINGEATKSNIYNALRKLASETTSRDNVLIYFSRRGAAMIIYLFSQPVNNLSYHASGVKVGEPASWVGLGWSLNAGGRVMRTVMGKPDEHFGGYFFSGLTVQNIPDMDPNNPLIPGTPAYQALDDIFQGNIDGEADIFSFNFAGYSGKFYFDKNGEPVLVPKQNLLIQRHDKSTSNESDRIKGFTFIAPDGSPSGGHCLPCISTGMSPMAISSVCAGR